MGVVLGVLANSIESTLLPLAKEMDRSNLEAGRDVTKKVESLYGALKQPQDSTPSTEIFENATSILFDIIKVARE